MKINKEQVGTNIDYVFGDDIKGEKYDTFEQALEVCRKSKNPRSIPTHRELKEGDTIKLIVKKKRTHLDVITMDMEDVIELDHNETYDIQYGECKVEEVYRLSIHEDYKDINGMRYASIKFDSNRYMTILPTFRSEMKYYEPKHTHAIKVTGVIWFDEMYCDGYSKSKLPMSVYCYEKRNCRFKHTDSQGFIECTKKEQKPIRLED